MNTQQVTTSQQTFVFNGSDYDATRDHSRLSTQIERIRDLMLDGRWRTVNMISYVLHSIYRTVFPENSVQAQLRNLRKRANGGFVVSKRRTLEGLYEYRVERGN